AASTASDTYEGAKAVVGAAAHSVGRGVDEALDTVKKTAGAVGSAVASVGEALTPDPEKTRADLLAKGSGGRGRAQSLDPRIVATEQGKVGRINAHVATLNEAPGLAVVAPTLPLLAPLGEGILALLEALAIALGLTVGGLILLIAIIILAIIL